jgi:uncharacterized protein (UPF0147 family)
MFTSCILLIAIAQAPAAAAEKKDPFHPQILVQAKAIRVVYSRDGEQPDGAQEVTFQIQHVYSGDAKLKGKTFQSGFSVAWHNPENPTLSPPIKEGEVGIWDLSYDDDGKLTVASWNYGARSIEYRWGLATPTPARKITAEDDYHVSYAFAVKWAGVVETIYTAAPAERPKLLRRQIFSDNPYVAAWSTLLLAQYAPADLIPYLKKIVEDPNLSVAAQVTIDHVLSTRNREKWLPSKQRAALLQRWFSGDITEPRQVRMIVVHIQQALKDSNLDWVTWLPLMEKWVIQQRLTWHVEWALYEFYHTTRSHGNPTPKFIARRNLIVRRAFDLLKSSKDQNTQIYAANWLYHINDLTDKELAIVKDLKEKTKDEHVRALLAAAIRDSTPKPRRP